MPDIGQYIEIVDGSPIDLRREAHLLRIAVAHEGLLEGLTAQSLRPLVLEALAYQLEVLSFVFGRHYWAEWTIDVQPEEQWQSAKIADKGAVPILAGRASAAIVLPPTFRLGANPMGRMDGHADPEGPFRRAFEGHVHACVRFIGGIITAILGNARKGQANRHAVEIIAPRLVDVAEFYQLPRPGHNLEAREERTRRVIDRIVDDLRLPALARYRLGDKRAVGQRFYERGLQLADTFKFKNVREISDCVDVINQKEDKRELRYMVETLDLLAKAFIRARQTHLGQRAIRAEAETEPPADIIAASAAAPYDPDGLDMLTAAPQEEEFSWDEARYLARNHDLDVSRIDIHQAWRRPVIAAWRAIGNWEYLKKPVTSDDPDFVLAHHHLASMSADDYEARATWAAVPSKIDDEARRAIAALTTPRLERLPTYRDPDVAEPAW